MSRKQQKDEVKKLYKIKLAKYENEIDDLTLTQRAKLYRLLMREAIIEAGFAQLTAEQCKLLITERGC